MRIIGIDPGSRLTGYGIVDFEGDRSSVVDFGVIKAGGGEFAERLGIIFNGLRELVESHQPDAAAIESVFVSHNASSAIKLGQARGAAICAVIAGKITVAEYSPRSVKQAIVGRGAADKSQVQHMVRVLLGLRETPPEDAADALAVALCHHHTQSTLSRLAGL
ncbi:MAG: crossover junction endodeoxyribonuclease RuvC [Xanthomonadales bacterium]|nr:crossover junction endodeoxyribonuclease RuvC [Gammaproteobacteria bacterium]NNE04953.1 crossover junction endodeoxyribonuclease RuvC [Xanthomonadales bacterium]NNL94240.1 crossover junction endodeoxyribonuclease RuvC [Xanthomonadales bacterium]